MLESTAELFEFEVQATIYLFFNINNLVIGSKYFLSLYRVPFPSLPPCIDTTYTYTTQILPLLFYLFIYFTFENIQTNSAKFINVGMVNLR